MTRNTSAAGTVRFAKMQGIGNDYVYLETFGKFPRNAPALARAISDRHFGVGGDGMVLIGPSARADFSMRIFNADGSEAEMCGNAIRCVGKYVYDRSMTKKTSLSIDTPAGIRFLSLLLKGNTVSAVRVDMGEPVFDANRIPMAIPEALFINRKIVIDDVLYHATAVSMGNPHLVVPVPDVDALDLARIGPQFENHSLFPKRINTEFVQVVSPNMVRVRVWERGSGETLACGTGACATVAACARAQLTGREVTVRLTGGDLLIEWHTNGTLFMTGPATHVFDGTYSVPPDLAMERAMPGHFRRRRFMRLFPRTVFPAVTPDESGPVRSVNTRKLFQESVWRE